MSCFTISKKEYARAAGFLAGIATAPHPTLAHENFMPIYHHGKNRWMEPADFEDDFRRLFENNANAVAIRYNTAPETDANTYGLDLSKAMLYGRKLMQRATLCGVSDVRTPLRTAIYGLIRFFHSVEYQLDDPDCAKRARNILAKYYRALYDVLRYLDGVTDDEIKNTWGTFDTEHLQADA